MLGQFLDHSVLETAKGDSVEHQAQHARDILHAFLGADRGAETNVPLVEHVEMTAFIGGGDKERCSRPSRRFQEYQAEIPNSGDFSERRVCISAL